MTTLSIPTRHARLHERHDRSDWYAVSVPPPVAPDPRATFTTVSTALAAPITTRTRPRTDAVLALLARAAGADHLVPTPADPDAVVHRLAGRILSRYVHAPDHPALVGAAQRLGPR